MEITAKALVGYDKWHTTHIQTHVKLGINKPYSFSSNYYFCYFWAIVFLNLCLFGMSLSNYFLGVQIFIFNILAMKIQEHIYFFEEKNSSFAINHCTLSIHGKENLTFPLHCLIFNDEKWTLAIHFPSLGMKSYFSIFRDE